MKLQNRMEIASRVIRGMRLAGEPVSDEQLACAAWPQSVGKKVAVHTRAARMVRTRLVVEVEDRIWQRQLFTLSNQILGRLEKNLGRGVVEDLEFRIVPRRREPGRAVCVCSGAGSRRSGGNRGPGPAFHLQGIPKKGSGVRITEKEVRYVAALANLTLDDAEVARFRADLDGILEHMDKLNGSIPPAWNPWRRCSSSQAAGLREDIPEPPLGSEAALANAPRRGAGYFKVPKVIER